MKTFSPRPRDIERRWYVVDADGVVLGRLASQVATILRGKHKPIYAPHADTGDHVIVVNAKGIRVTGGKEFEKVYYRHSGFPGGLRKIGYEGLLAERPGLAVEKAIGGMLPKNRLGRQTLKKLFVYEGPEHPHQAQMPVSLGLGEYPRWEGLPKPAPPVQPREPKAKARKEATGPRPRAGGPEQEAPPARRRRSAAGSKTSRGGSRGAAKAGPATQGTARKAAARSSAATASKAKAASAKGVRADDAAKSPAEAEKPKRTRRAKKES
jgi:large subunit ribosomal protein L13